MDIADIPNLPSREERFEAITVDCYNEYEQLSAFEVYLSDALRTPFAALWGAPGTERLPVTVLGARDGSEDDGVLLRVRLADGDEQEVLADQLWAIETPGVNAIVLDDYRAFVAEGDLPHDDDNEVSYTLPVAGLLTMGDPNDRRSSPFGWTRAANRSTAARRATLR